MLNRFVFISALMALAVFSATPAAAQVDVRIGSSTALDGGNARLAVSGDLTNDGAFTPSSSTVAFTGAEAQTVSGVIDFATLDVDKPDDAALSVGKGAAVRDTLALTGGTLDNDGDFALGDGATIRRRAGALSAAPTFGATVNIEYEGEDAVSTGNEVPDAESDAAVRDFTIGNAGGVTLTKPVEVSGTLALREGTLDNSQASLTVSESGSVEPGGGDISEPPAYEGPVVLIYDGRAARTTGAELPDTTSRLIVRNPAGVTLGKDLVVLDTLSVQEGTLALGGRAVTLAAPNAVLLEAPGAVVSGESGAIRATRPLDAPQNANVAGLGFRITSDADLGATTIARSHEAPFGSDDGSDQIAVARVYAVTPENNAGLDASVAFSYDETEWSGNTEEPIRLYRSDDDGATWTDVGGAVDTTANVVTLGGLGSLARFTAGAPATAVSAEDAPGAPQAFALHGNYPNPFSAATTIRYDLPRAARVRLDVFDVMGRRVATLADAPMPAGTHDVRFDAAELPAGVYFARMRAGSEVAVRRLVRVR